MSTLFLTHVRNKVDLVSLVCENDNLRLQWPLIHNLPHGLTTIFPGKSNSLVQTNEVSSVNLKTTNIINFDEAYLTATMTLRFRDHLGFLIVRLKMCEWKVKVNLSFQLIAIKLFRTHNDVAGQFICGQKYFWALVVNWRFRIVLPCHLSGQVHVRHEGEGPVKSWLVSSVCL